MIARDAQPIGHTPPLRRIDLNARAKPGNPDSDLRPDFTFSPAECDRIWDLVRQAAAGESAA